MGNELNPNEYAAQLTAIAVENATKAIGSTAASALDSVERVFRSMTQGYITQTKARVSTFRTLLKSHPIDLLDNFVPMTMVHGNKEIDEISFVEMMQGPARFVVSAPAGRGKSVLMRYIALTKSLNSKGQIPLFVELRQLNDISSKDIVAFTWGSYDGGKYSTLKSFQDNLTDGKFCLVLDGFDEINPENRNEITSGILNISRVYKKTPIVVSGRPDELFKSWPDFSTVFVKGNE